MLPGELHATVQEVEQLAGCEIAVVPDAAASEFNSLQFGIEAGVCHATIAYRGDSVSRCAILHELLHLKRYWLDAVPILRPTASRYELEAQALEDFVEHLVIIPEERRFEESESNAHWSAVTADNLAQMPRVSFASSPGEVDSLQRIQFLQRHINRVDLSVHYHPLRHYPYTD